MSKLTSNCVRIQDLKASEIKDMFVLFGEYYANVSETQFQTDLAKKDYVFLLKCAQSRQIKGFSTIVSIRSELANKKVVYGCFSGDTVIHKDYWGQGTLGVAFLKFLFLQKLRRPLVPLYWFLISKGYKTYLLMANNFSNYYPRFEEPTPAESQAILDSFAFTLYPDQYNPERGIISSADLEHKDHLKSNVAPISESLLANPRIAFFQAKNPNWLQGEELACIAEMTLWMPLKYQSKLMVKQLQKLLPRVKTSPISTEDVAVS